MVLLGNLLGSACFEKLGLLQVLRVWSCELKPSALERVRVGWVLSVSTETTHKINVLSLLGGESCVGAWQLLLPSCDFDNASQRQIIWVHLLLSIGLIN